MKRNIAVFAILFIIVYFNLKAAIEFTSNYEPLNSDLIGIISNSSTILCYGSHGIILKSDISNQNWSQIYIGELDTIKKIINFKENFIGITSKYIIKSIDNAKNWIILKILKDTNEKLVSITNLADTIYFLSNRSIYKSNFDFSNIEMITNISKNTNIDVYELNSDTNTLSFVKYNLIDQKLYISYYNIETNKFVDEEIEYESDEGTRIYTKLINLKFKVEKGLEVLLLNTKPFNVGSTVTKIFSKVNNKWGIIYNNQNDSLRLVNTFTLHNGSVYLLSPDTLNYVNLIKIDKDNTLNFITKKSVDRLIKPTYQTGLSQGIKTVSYNRAYINDIYFVSDSVIFAVDNDKLIISSKNGGIQWNVISSFFSSLINLNSTFPSLYAPKSDVVFIPNSYINNKFLQVLKTSNGGITWLPQINDSLIFDTNSSLTFGADSNGNVIVIKQSRINRQDIEFYHSNDFGDNFSKRDIKKLFENESSYISQLFNFSSNIIIKTISMATKEEYPKSTLFICDKELNLIKKVVIDSVLIYNFGYTKNNDLFALGLKHYQLVDSDSGYYYNRKVLLFKSTDKGNSWREMNINIPVTFDFFTVYKNERIYDSYLNSLFLNDKVLILNSYTLQNNNQEKANKIYLVNLYTQMIDSALIFTQNYKLQTLLLIKDHPFLVDPKNNLFYQINLNNIPISITDSFKIKDVFPFFKSMDDFGNYALLSILSKYNQFWLIIGEKVVKSDITGTYTFLKSIPYKINFDKFVNVVEDKTEKIIKRDVYLDNDAPYPIPSSDIISAVIYWNSKYDINTANFEVYNIYGERIKDANISIEQQNNFSAKINLECSNLPSGTYFLQVKLGEELKSIQIIINR